MCTNNRVAQFIRFIIFFCSYPFGWSKVEALKLNAVLLLTMATTSMRAILGLIFCGCATIAPSAAFHVATRLPSGSSRLNYRAASVPTRVALRATGENRESDAPRSSRGTARLSTPKTSGATGSLDSALTLLTSDGASIVLGIVGITICLFNRVIHIDDYDALNSTGALGADAMGRQSRADLLAVFASGAVLLNGISNLDVTSALAESVVMDGISLNSPVIYDEALDDVEMNLSKSSRDDLIWALESLLDATPAQTAVVVANGRNGWRPMASAGIIPTDSSMMQTLSNIPTPILDRFLPTARGGASTKESYLPTLQALPGKTELKYLPPNAQEALILPIRAEGDAELESVAVLVLGSDTAKSCTPRDIAWCQVLASRIGTFIS